MPWSILRPRATASKPTSRRTSSYCSKHLPERSCGGAASVSKLFQTTRNRKPEREIKSWRSIGSAWITLGSLTLRSFSLPSPLSPLLPEGAGMEPIIVPVIALLASAVIRNRRDWFRGHDKCRGQVRSGFVDYNQANNPFAMSLSSPSNAVILRIASATSSMKSRVSWFWISKNEQKFTFLR